MLDASIDQLQSLSSPQFMQTAERVAHAIGADPVLAIQGQSLGHRGLVFSLRHYGPLDPGGVFVVVELGPLPDENAASVCKTLLEHHLAVPAALTGYYALIPGKDTMAYCFRVDAERHQDPTRAIVDFIESVVAQGEQFVQAVDRELRVRQNDEEVEAHRAFMV